MNLRYNFISTLLRLRNKFIFNFTNYNVRFNEIFKQNLWTSNESISGPGSDLKSTVSIRNELNSLIEKYNIKTILDIPCGDFHWMSKVDLTDVNYCGGDIVEELIIRNSKTYKTTTIDFRKLDLIADALPTADLIIVRDCFIHFSYKLIFSALQNIKKSKSQYLLITSYPDIKTNINIKTGNNFNINLEAEPFNFPKPLMFIDEKEQFAIEHGRKIMGLWRINDLREFI